MSWAVRFEDVVKRYRGARETHLRHDLAQLGAALAAKLRRAPTVSQGRTAVDHVSFEVAQGEAFALLGPNGAGKTTCLRLLARISYPTSGRLRVRGRVAALIEIGSGIHPELTGRENIWLYGRIMGMSRSDIARRFDQIVEFAELQNELNVPVKRYSTGMQLRLGFAIASHLDPDIFVVDEALAVGDAGFQAKCIERMTQLLSEGKTLVFVSHNLTAVETMCSRGAFLLAGKVEMIGDVRPVLRRYLEWTEEAQLQRKAGRGAIRGRDLTVEHVTLHDMLGHERYVFTTGDVVTVRLHVRAERDIPTPWFTLGITDGRPGALVVCSMLEQSQAFSLLAGEHVVTCQLGPLPLRSRTYELWLSVRESVGAAELVDWTRVAALRLESPQAVEGVAGVTGPWQFGTVHVPHRWSVGASINSLVGKG
ncbi:MAG TPA: ABC transporter ATP-binding protein [bacterium]|nr:ABC transporter ATP-binding protein [bacterium]